MSTGMGFGPMRAVIGAVLDVAARLGSWAGRGAEHGGAVQ
jgi:hypothetical protein